MVTLYSRTLRQAAGILGSERRLSKFLGVAPDDLAAWMRGEHTPPAHVFLGAVDIIELDAAIEAPRAPRD